VSRSSYEDLIRFLNAPGRSKMEPPKQEQPALLQRQFRVRKHYSPLPRGCLEDLANQLDPLRYTLGLTPNRFLWQQRVLASTHKRKLINGARQSGKSTIIAAKPAHLGRFFYGCMAIVVGATEKQATEDMEKIKDYISRDPHYPRIVRDSDSLLETEHGTRILVVPATEKGARGYSNPDITGNRKIDLIILDEAARIEDGVYRSGIRPMLTDNPWCELLAISTPNGREGFFYRAQASEQWEKYEIRAPWDVDDQAWDLLPAALSEAQYQALRAKKGIQAFHSPRHLDQKEQLDNLEEMGPRLFRQEYLVEFVEPEMQVFAYDHIERAFSDAVQPMSFGLPEIADIPVLEVHR